MITRAEAEDTRDALEAAAKDVPIHQLRALLIGLHREWANAISDAGGHASDGTEVTIEMAGVVTRGMRVWHWKGWCTVARNLGGRDGQFSIHAEDDEGRPVYLNRMDASSPVVVAP